MISYSHNDSEVRKIVVLSILLGMVVGGTVVGLFFI